MGMGGISGEKYAVRDGECIRHMLTDCSNIYIIYYRPSERERPTGVYGRPMVTMRGIHVEWSKCLFGDLNNIRVRNKS